MISAVLSTPELWESLAVGILVLACVFTALRRAFPTTDRTAPRVSAVSAGAAGFLVTSYLLQNPLVLERYVQEIILGWLGILLAFITFLRRARPSLLVLSVAHPSVATGHRNMQQKERGQERVC